MLLVEVLVLRYFGKASYQIHNIGVEATRWPHMWFNLLDFIYSFISSWFKSQSLLLLLVSGETLRWFTVTRIGSFTAPEQQISKYVLPIKFSVIERLFRMNQFSRFQQEKCFSSSSGDMRTITEDKQQRNEQTWFSEGSWLAPTRRCWLTCFLFQVKLLFNIKQQFSIYNLYSGSLFF